MLYSSPFLIKIRDITRKMGLNKVIGTLLAGQNYEDKFGPKIIEKIQEGDCVWDIGANIGVYSKLFAEKAGEKGIVVAFEPIEASYLEVIKLAQKNTSIKALNYGMGEQDEELVMELSDEELAPTHRIAVSSEKNKSHNTTTVKIRSGKSILEEYPDWKPNVVKIDVEGFEASVINGMEEIIKDKNLRCLGIEMHFGILKERQQMNAPYEIQKKLEDNNFIVQWTDPSHIIAERKI